MHRGTGVRQKTEFRYRGDDRLRTARPHALLHDEEPLTHGGPRPHIRISAADGSYGARLCGNGLEIAVLGDSALEASALESRSLGLWGLGDASVHRWRRSDVTGAATAQP